MQREFLAGWWNMFNEKHHFRASDVAWMASIVAFILTGIGIFALDRDEQPVVWLASLLALAAIMGLYIWHGIIQIPAAMLAKVKMESRRLLDTEAQQRRHLLEHPSAHVAVIVKKIILAEASMEKANIAEVRLYVMNGSVFEIDYDVGFKETELAVDHVNIPLVTRPVLYGKGADKLGIGSLSSEMTIRQPLGGEVADMLYKPEKMVYSQWKFHVMLTLKFDGQQKTHEYTPEWDGVIDRRWKW